MPIRALRQSAAGPRLVFGLFAVLSLAMVVTTLPTPVEAQRIGVDGQGFVIGQRPVWINGANTPWLRWNEFGEAFDATAWEREFQLLVDHRVNATRVWLMGNGRVGAVIDASGRVEGMTDQFWRDVDQLFAIARRHKVHLMVSLLTHEHTRERCFDRFNARVDCPEETTAQAHDFERWRAMYASASTRQSFVDNVVVPLIQRHGDNPYFWAIDVGNELDWTWDTQQLPMADTLDLVARAANAVHARSTVLVTSGAGTGPKYLSPTVGSPQNVWSDASLGALQAGAHLDFYKLHFYPWQAPHFGTPFDVGPGPAGYAIADKPVVVGEFPARGVAGYSPQQAYRRLFEQGYAGAMAWTSNGIGDHGDIEDLGQGTRWIHARYPQLVYPRGPEGPDEN